MIKAHHIIELACKQAKVTPRELMYRIGEKKYIYARHLCYFLLLKYVKGITKYRIAEIFDRDISSVYSGLEVVNKILDKKNPTTQETILIENIAECELFLNHNFN